VERPAPPLHIAPRDARFPPELRALQPPVEDLWAAGAIELLGRRPRVAIVGTRAPTPYGSEQARRLAGALARAGVAVVSGLARGIDDAAHAACLDAGGTTLAVLGSGLDRVWPSGPTAERVARDGLLLSEYGPGTPPRRHHFPLRNRLIAALSSAVVVVEAAARSGSLITARWALDLGREVLAVPGRVDHPLARGTHRLLREGAGLVEGPADVLEALGVAPDEEESTPARPDDPLLAALVGETLSPAELAARLGRPLSEVLAALAVLELDGRVARVPGGLVRRTRTC